MRPEAASMRPEATSVCGLKLLVYEALSYYKLKEKLEDRDTSAGEALSY